MGYARMGYASRCDAFTTLEPCPAWRTIPRPMATEKPFDARRWIEVERLRLVSGNLLSTLLAGLASAALVAFLLREVAPLPLLVGWLVAGTLISWNRYRNLRRFRALPDEEIDTSTWSVRL